MDFGLATKFGPYRVLKRIGAGGMGVVFCAEHEKTGRQVAIKTARVPYGCTVVGLRCEIHALTRIRHPGVVQILDEGLEDGVPWYAMELLADVTLADYRKSLWADYVEEAPTLRVLTTDPQGEAPSPVPSITPLCGVAAAGRLPQVLRLMRRICAPLAFLHQSGIVHRDLKPGNVFIRADGTPVLVDFGLVASVRGGGWDTCCVITRAAGPLNGSRPVTSS
jgi:eukaryotic-like serine/threonine-protein kinase